VRKLIVIITALAALAAPAAALANNAPNSLTTGPGGVVIGSTQGNGVQQYKATYDDPYAGPLSCTGTHHAAAKNKAAFDSFTCTSTTGKALTGLTSGSSFSTPPSGYIWTSDFNGTDQTYNFAGTVSADGMSYSAVATYNS
jgi:hypothetical protein